MCERGSDHFAGIVLVDDCAPLGFGSLLLVSAQPLRELGFSGVVGTVVALVCAYTMYPSFLDSAAPKGTKNGGATSRVPFLGAELRVGLGAHRIIVLMSAGLTRLNTDPSLLDYFKKGKEPREGLAYVDRNGGSNIATPNSRTDVRLKVCAPTRYGARPH